MDNNSRSERTRGAVISAALAIIARDGPSRLTLDAIAKEAGISKGGVMHQFPTKEAVLRALLDHQRDYFQGSFARYQQEHGAEHSRPRLAGRIASAREAATQPNSLALAIMAAMAQDPSLLSSVRDGDAVVLEEIRQEGPDPDLATLRWLAARGLVTTALMGMCPLSPEDRDRLFARLLDDGRWDGLADH
jgi:AcrR family transcriptional regulator